MTWMMNTTTILTAISVVLLLVLLVLYIRNLRSVKSKLLIGLIIFVGLFLLQNAVSLFYYVTMMDYYVAGVEPHMFVFSLLQTIAFAIMLWISWD